MPWHSSGRLLFIRPGRRSMCRNFLTDHHQCLHLRISRTLELRIIEKYWFFPPHPPFLWTVCTTHLISCCLFQCTLHSLYCNALYLYLHFGLSCPQTTITIQSPLSNFSLTSTTYKFTIQRVQCPYHKARKQPKFGTSNQTNREYLGKQVVYQNERRKGNETVELSM